MSLFVFILVIVLGLVMGSFVNVVIGRTLSGESFVSGRSRCDHCKQLIAWYDNVPLLSFVLLGGRCRQCKKRISWQHPVVEIMTALLFVWWYGVGFAFFQLTQSPLPYLQPAFWLVIGILLLIVVISDLISTLIPDYAVVGLGILALLYRLYLVSAGVMEPLDLWRAIFIGESLAVLFGLIIAMTKGRGMGWGDVKLILVLGWLVGYPRMVVGTFLSFFIGAMVGIVLLAFKKRRFGQAIPFGPFLVLGALLALVWGNSIWSWYWGLV